MDKSAETRVERDSMGEMQVPADAYYGASTQRAVLNFPISDLRFPRQFTRALGQIKQVAARTNAALGTIDPQIAEAIVQAAQEVIDGRFDSHFVLDIFQTGSGTSTNMNANEVIANRASELLGGPGALTCRMPRPFAWDRSSWAMPGRSSAVSRACATRRASYPRWPLAARRSARA